MIVCRCFRFSIHVVNLKMLRSLWAHCCLFSHQFYFTFFFEINFLFFFSFERHRSSRCAVRLNSALVHVLHTPYRVTEANWPTRMCDNLQTRYTLLTVHFLFAFNQVKLFRFFSFRIRFDLPIRQINHYHSYLFLFYLITFYGFSFFSFASKEKNTFLCPLSVDSMHRFHVTVHGCSATSMKPEL